MLEGCDLNSSFDLLKPAYCSVPNGCQGHAGYLSLCRLAARAALPAFFAVSVLGTNCFPSLLPARFLRSVSSLSSLDKEAHAFSGR